MSIPREVARDRPERRPLTPKVARVWTCDGCGKRAPWGQSEAVRAHRELEALNADMRAEQEKDIMRLEVATAEMRRALEEIAGPEAENLCLDPAICTTKTPCVLHVARAALRAAEGREDTKPKTDELGELLGALEKARGMLRDCHWSEVDCDDEDGGMGRARRAEWCGGPCALREDIDRLLGPAAEKAPPCPVCVAESRGIPYPFGCTCRPACAAEKAPESPEPDDREDPREVGYPSAPEAREPAPPAERAPDEPCLCGKWRLPRPWEAVTDAGTNRLRHSRTECLTATERRKQAKAPAPPAAAGLTAEELTDLASVLEAFERRGWNMGGLLPRVRAAAEKAGGR